MTRVASRRAQLEPRRPHPIRGKARAAEPAASTPSDRSALRGDGRGRQVALLPASVLELTTRSRGHAESRVGFERGDEPLEVVGRQGHVRVELCDQFDLLRKCPQPQLKRKQIPSLSASLTQPLRPAIGVLEHDPRVRLGELSRDGRRAVGGTVVDDDPGAGSQRLADDGRRQCGEMLRFVTGGRDERIAAHLRGRPHGLGRIIPTLVLTRVPARAEARGQSPEQGDSERELLDRGATCPPPHLPRPESVFQGRARAVVVTAGVVNLEIREHGRAEAQALDVPDVVGVLEPEDLPTSLAEPPDAIVQRPRRLEHTPPTGPFRSRMPFSSVSEYS